MSQFPFGNFENRWGGLYFSKMSQFQLFDSVFFNITFIRNVWISKSSELQQCNFPNLQLCNNATMQQCNFATLQLCNFATMQQCNNATMQHCNFATLPLCHFATFPLCNFAILQLCNFALRVHFLPSIHALCTKSVFCRTS